MTNLTLSILLIISVALNISMARFVQSSKVDERYQVYNNKLRRGKMKSRTTILRIMRELKDLKKEIATIERVIDMTLFNLKRLVENEND
jgi:hypothetical protein